MANRKISHIWSDDIEDILDRIRENSATLSNFHKNQYYKYKGYLKYFRIPTIVLSAIGSVTSVGFKPYLNQDIISISTCFIGLSVGILNSIELFLSIQSTMEKSLSNSKDFYLLAIDIKKILLLDREHRVVGGKEYLEEKYNSYCELIKTSELINKEIKDKLLPLESNGNNVIAILNRRRKNRKEKKEKKNKLIELDNKYSKLNNKIVELEDIEHRRNSVDNISIERSESPNNSYNDSYNNLKKKDRYLGEKDEYLERNNDENYYSDNEEKSQEISIKIDNRDTNTIDSSNNSVSIELDGNNSENDSDIV